MTTVLFKKMGALKRILFVFGLPLPLMLVLKWLTASYYTGMNKVHRRRQTQTGRPVETFTAWPGSSPFVILLDQEHTVKSAETLSPQPQQQQLEQTLGISTPELLRNQLPREGATKSFLEEDTAAPDCPLLCEPMVGAIERGGFSFARFLALRVRNEHPECETTLAALYSFHANHFLSIRPTGVPLSRMALVQETSSNGPLLEETDCWIPGGDDGLDLEGASNLVLERWDTCCSQLKPKRSKAATTGGVGGEGKKKEEKLCYQTSPPGHKRRRLCCGLFPGSLSHLRLPALQELTISLRLVTSPTSTYQVTLEQDGFLRKYDPAGVLWPTGYLLCVCLAYPDRCGLPEVLGAVRGHHDSVVSVELGAGIGAPSIVLSRVLEQLQSDTPSKARRVLATDRAMHALALVATNSQKAGGPVLVAQIEDHTNVTQLNEVMEGTVETIGGGYAIVLGSSLESLFDWKTRDPKHQLWVVLDTLVCKINRDAIAVLAHISGAVVPPKGGIFELVRTVSGNDLEMFTRTGDDSDFAISMYRRKRIKRQQEYGGILQEF
jgi:hypothetical protein